MTHKDRLNLAALLLMRQSIALAKHERLGTERATFGERQALIGEARAYITLANEVLADSWELSDE